MKKIVFAIFFFAALSCFSQARLGSTRSEIYKEFSEYNPQFESNEGGQPYMHFQLGRAVVMHYFDEENICALTAIAPNDQGDLNYFVELYNRQYVIIGPKQWKMYSENGTIATIELITNNGTTFFIWN
jgi:hypothetical protein